MSDYYTDDDVTAGAVAITQFLGALDSRHRKVDSQVIAGAVLAAVAPAIAARTLRDAADLYVKGIYPECGFVESFLHDLAERAEQVEGRDTSRPTPDSDGRVNP